LSQNRAFIIDSFHLETTNVPIWDTFVSRQRPKRRLLLKRHANLSPYRTNTNELNLVRSMLNETVIENRFPENGIWKSGRTSFQKRFLMKRAGQLDEIKSTALYLATCPSFLTGAEISIDGGHLIV